MKFSLIIPCYNEAENIPFLLDRCKLTASHPGVEIILVNNGSTDGSEALFEKLLPLYPGCRLLSLDHNKGYGGGIIAGLNIAKGDLLGWTHADLQTDPKDALTGLALLENTGSSSFIKGRRYGRPFSDIFFTVGMSFFESLILSKPMWDINAQPTMFSRKFFDTWISPPTDFSLDLYAYYSAKRQKLSIHRFPVEFAKRSYGVSSWNINWTGKWKFIRRTLAFSFRLKRTLQLWK
ncbi:glycosyltransferase family 2 protein [Planktomarina sp.]|nr:glycosyltransferase family 2 protein [Planktomarina sp.]